MPSPKTLTQAAPTIPRFTDHVHAMTTQLALTGAINGVEHLITNLKRMIVPPHQENGHTEALNELASQLQGLRNMEKVFTMVIDRQTAEGTL
jgi:hypothetical protein